MKVTLEQVQHGYWLVDCDECGCIGVWQTRSEAIAVKRLHECGQYQTDHRTPPGKVKTQIIIGGRPTGQRQDDHGSG